MPAEPGVFTPGQHLSGLVLQALADGKVLVAFGDRRLVAETQVPLPPGQEILVEVVRTGATIEMRLERQTLPEAGENAGTYELATLLNALQRRGSSTAPADPAALLKALAALIETGAPQQLALLRDALARLLQPLLPGEDPRVLAAALRSRVQDGGFLLETHLRTVLAGGNPPDPEGAVADVQSDLRVLLGRLARSVTTGSGAGDPAASLDGELAQLAARVLDQQVVFAYRWTAEGAADFEVRMGLPSGEVAVNVRVHRERDRAATPGRSPRLRVSVLVPSDTLGPIEAAVSWQGSGLEGVFYVDRESTRAVLASGIVSLTARLAAAFKRVAFDVRVDAGRLRNRAANLRPPDLPGGSVVSVRV